MSDSYSAATRILVVYESALPFGRPATLSDRIEAMRYAVESLGLLEKGGSANIKELVRAAKYVTP